MALAVFALAVAVGGCGVPVATQSSSASVSSPSVAPARSAPISGEPSASGAVVADQGLLDALPPSIAGLDQQRDVDRDAELIANPSVAALGSGLASALYIDPSIGDFAYATVVRLRTGTLDEGTFRSWRDSFDEGACSQSGGVVGHAEADLGGHRTFIGSCAGGVRTHHTVTEDGLLVSVSSVSERRLGEQVIEGLRALP